MPLSPVRRRLVLALPALAGVAVAPDALAQTQPAVRPERPRVVVAVCGRTMLPCLALTVAEQLHYFSAEGLDVELHDHTNTMPAKAALLKGAADVAVGGFEHAVLLRQREFNSVAFALLSRAPQMVFGVSTMSVPQFRQIPQLKGARIGVAALDSPSQFFAQLVLGRGGLSAEDVEFVSVGSASDAVAALRGGRIDAIAGVDPIISLLEARGDIRLAADTRSLRNTHDLYGGPMPGSCLYTAQSFLVRYPQTAQALVNAVVRALKWLQTAGPSDIVRVVPEAYMLGDRSVYLGALEKSRESLSPDGVTLEEGVQTAFRMVERYAGDRSGVRTIAPGSTFTNDFARRAKQRFQASSNLPLLSPSRLT